MAEKTGKQILNYLYRKRFRKEERIDELNKEIRQLNKEILWFENKYSNDK